MSNHHPHPSPSDQPSTVTVTLVNGTTMKVHEDTVIRDHEDGSLYEAGTTDTFVRTVFEPMREFWPRYEPWMRDVLTDDARVSWDSVSSERRSTWSGLRHFANKDATGWMKGCDLRVHPDDVPERPTEHVHSWTRHQNVTTKGHVMPAYETCNCGEARPSEDGPERDQCKEKHDEIEAVLDSRAGLALANAAWQEGASATLRACNLHLDGGEWKKPVSPYSAQLLARIAEERGGDYDADEAGQDATEYLIRQLKASAAAQTHRARKAEAERDHTRKSLDDVLAGWNRDGVRYRAERDDARRNVSEAVARAEKAEAERDDLSNRLADAESWEQEAEKWKAKHAALRSDVASHRQDTTNNPCDGILDRDAAREPQEGDAYEPVWDNRVPPGGFVCNICGMPVESEPCPDHGPDEGEGR